MTEIVKSYNEQAKAYDDFTKKLVPDYEVFHDLLLDFLVQVTNLVDIGCGTGNISLRLLDSNPALQLTAAESHHKRLPGPLAEKPARI
ncbi:MAG: methyltransferase [Deltaproteobacteria bacterium]|jgi:trans-aconitate methyltransferase|nr:methyltransferase [Deltaproteobacteria bacterium]